MPTMIERGADHRELFLRERAEALGDPVDHDHGHADEADEHHRPAQQQAVLEAEAPRACGRTRGRCSPMK